MGNESSQGQGQRPGNQQGNGQPAEKITRGTVARGRTIDVPDPSQRQVVGHTPEGKAIYRSANRSYGPGQEVELPYGEIVGLRARGFLIDPGAPLPPLADGPHYTETGQHANAG